MPVAMIVQTADTRRRLGSLWTLHDLIHHLSCIDSIAEITLVGELEELVFEFAEIRNILEIVDYICVLSALLCCSEVIVCSKETDLNFPRELVRISG
jgi:hypothetical protein